MNFTYIKKYFSLPIIVLSLLIFSCNKEVEQFPELKQPSASASVINYLSASSSDSMYLRLIQKSGLTTTLSNLSGDFTLLVPDNAAMTASGFSSAVISATPAATAAAIVSYNIIPKKITSSGISATFPNNQLATMIIMDPTNPFVRMTTFFSKNGSQFYANNIPLAQMDIDAGNAIIHKPLRIVAPPSTTLKGAIASEADLSLFRAALVKADEGQTGLNRFDSLLNYGVTNMTVLAPNNNAFKGLINVLSGGLVPLNAPDATFIGFISANIPAATARGILAYHLLATNPTGAYQPNIRVFSSNVSSAGQFIKTMLNSSVAAHPGFFAMSGFTGPFATSLKFTQYPPIPPSATPFSAPAANVVSMDKQAVNGVYHIIDRVLMPQ